MSGIMEGDAGKIVRVAMSLRSTPNWFWQIVGGIFF